MFTKAKLVQGGASHEVTSRSTCIAWWHYRYILLQMHVYVFVSKPRHWLGRTCQKWPVLCRVDVKKSINRVLN